MHLVIRVLGWALLELELGPQATEVEAEDQHGDALTGQVVDASGAPRYMGFTNGLETTGPYEDWRHRAPSS